VDIKDKTAHDPVADLHMPDAYMRWALLAAEEVTGKQGLNVVLREAGLERLVGNYPPNELTLTYNLKGSDYASLFAGLMNFYGRAGKSMLLRIGRLSSLYAIEQQGAVFNVAATMALKLLPYPTQLRMGLENMQAGFRKIWGQFDQEMRLRVEDRGDKIVYISETCPMCAGKQASKAICQSFTGSLQESIRWATGKEAEVEEVECRAMGAPACVWEIGKKPKG